MHPTIKISEAAVIAIHAVDLLVREQRQLSVQEISSGLGVSHNHLSKVLQRLERAGLVAATRGPKGGFSLTQRALKVRVKSVLEAIDGPLTGGTCLMKKRCALGACIFGSFLREIEDKFAELLAVKVSSLAGRK